MRPPASSDHGSKSCPAGWRALAVVLAGALRAGAEPQLPPDGSDHRGGEPDAPPTLEVPPDDLPAEPFVESDGERVTRTRVARVVQRAEAMREGLIRAVKRPELGPAQQLALALELTEFEKRLREAERRVEALAPPPQLDGEDTALLPSSEPYAALLLDAHRAAVTAHEHGRALKLEVDDAIDFAARARLARTLRQPSPFEASGLDESGSPPLPKRASPAPFWFEGGVEPRARTLTLARPNGEAAELRYRNNVPIAARLDLGYDVHRIDVAQSLGTARSAAEHGSSSTTTLGVDTLFESVWHGDLVVRVYYQRFRGVALDTPGVLQAGESPLRNDVQSDGLGSSGRYFFDGSFSYRSARGLSRFGGGSSGSFFGRSGVKYDALRADRGLVVPSQQAGYGDDASLNGLASFEWTTGLGYFHELSHRGFRAWGSLDLNLGMQLQEAELARHLRRTLGFVLEGEAALSLAYFGNGARAGIEVRGMASRVDLGDSRLSIRDASARAFAGASF